MNSATSATVSYNITLGGATALSNQTGTAVYQDGIWKVGDVSFCSLIKLEPPLLTDEELAISHSTPSCWLPAPQ